MKPLNFATAALIAAASAATPTLLLQPEPLEAGGPPPPAATMHSLDDPKYWWLNKNNDVWWVRPSTVANVTYFFADPDLLCLPTEDLLGLPTEETLTTNIHHTRGRRLSKVEKRTKGQNKQYQWDVQSKVMVLQALDEHAGNKERFSIAAEKFKAPKNNVCAWEKTKSDFQKGRRVGSDLKLRSESETIDE